jgi:chromosome partitioning protein
MDMTALIETIQKIIRPTGVKHRVLLTRVDTRRLNEAFEALSTLGSRGVPHFNALIRGYTAHERASLEGVPVMAFKGAMAKEAASDYERVLDEVLREW